VDDSDKAWVVQVEPANLWELPHNDRSATNIAQGFEVFVTFIGCGTLDFSKDNENTLRANFVEKLTPQEEGKDLKALDPAGNHPGDDLFITIRTSDQVKRFEKIRAVVPATLPQRSLEATRQAGVQFFPQVATSPGAFIKSNPEEDPVQDFYG